MEPHTRLSPGGLARQIVFISQQQAPVDFSRVDPGGTVYVHVGDIERSAGQIPDSTPEEALAFYTRRYENLVAEVILPASRVETQTMPPGEVHKAIGTARTNVTEANAVGDLAALTARLGVLEELPLAQIEACRAVRTEQNANTIAAEHAMVNKAEALASGSDWCRGVDRFREFLEEWRAFPRTDRTTDNELWYRFSSARTQHMRRRKAHFSELSARRDEAECLKEQIIAEATPLAKSIDWGLIVGAFRDPIARWWAAGSAWRADDESLWVKFHALQDQSFKARSAAQHAVDDEQAENLVAKAALLEQVERDLADVTNVNAAKTTLRGFLPKFSEIGHVSRAAMRDLDSRARKLPNRAGELEAECWHRADPEARKRVEDTVALFQSQVDRLIKDPDAAEAAGNARKAKGVYKSPETYTSQLDQARQTLQDFQDM